MQLAVLQDVMELHDRTFKVARFMATVLSGFVSKFPSVGSEAGTLITSGLLVATVE